MVDGYIKCIIVSVGDTQVLLTGYRILIQKSWSFEYLKVTSLFLKVGYVESCYDPSTAIDPRILTFL